MLKSAILCALNCWKKIQWRSRLYEEVVLCSHHITFWKYTFLFIVLILQIYPFGCMLKVIKCNNIIGLVVERQQFEYWKALPSCWVAWVRDFHKKEAVVWAFHPSVLSTKWNFPVHVSLSLKKKYKTFHYLNQSEPPSFFFAA